MALECNLVEDWKILPQLESVYVASWIFSMSLQIGVLVVFKIRYGWLEVSYFPVKNLLSGDKTSSCESRDWKRPKLVLTFSFLWNLFFFSWWYTESWNLHLTVIWRVHWKNWMALSWMDAELNWLKITEDIGMSPDLIKFCWGRGFG